MKKLKKFYHDNRVFSILMIIVIICFVIIGILFFDYFFMGLSKSKYGNRLKAVENINLSKNDEKDILAEAKNNEFVSDVSLNIRGRIIYIQIEFKETATLDNGKSLADQMLIKVPDEIKGVYDVHFTLYKQLGDENDFVIMGAKNKNNSSISWNNNTPLPETQTPVIDEE